jgi:hypothetical protein
MIAIATQRLIRVRFIFGESPLNGRVRHGVIGHVRAEATSKREEQRGNHECTGWEVLAGLEQAIP